MDDRWAFLRPWMAPVREHLRLHRVNTRGVPLARYGGMLVDLPLDDEATLGSVRDALVLLALVSRAGACEYKRVLKTQCDLDPGQDVQVTESEASGEPRFVLSAEEDSSGEVQERAWAASSRTPWDDQALLCHTDCKRRRLCSCRGGDCGQSEQCQAVRPTAGHPSRGVRSVAGLSGMVGEFVANDQGDSDALRRVARPRSATRDGSRVRMRVRDRPGQVRRVQEADGPRRDRDHQ